MSDQKEVKKLSPADWATIVTLASRGEKTLRELADQFKVSKQAISQGLAKRGVTLGSRVQDVVSEVEDEAAAARKKKVQDAHKTADDYSKRIELLSQLTIKRIVEANQGGGIATANGDILTLKNAMAIIAKGRDEQWSIHKIDELLQEDEDLAELNVGEYTEEELEAIKAANEEAYQQSLDDDDLGLGGFEDDEEDDDELVAD